MWVITSEIASRGIIKKEKTTMPKLVMQNTLFHGDKPARTKIIRQIISIYLNEVIQYE